MGEAALTLALLLWLPVAVPLLAAILLMRSSRPLMAAVGGAAGATAGLLACAALLLLPRPTGALAGAMVTADALSLWLLLPAATVGLAAALQAVAAAPPPAVLDRAGGRVRHAALQVLLGAHHLALLADGLVLTWAAVLAAVLAALPLLLTRPTPAAAAVAWRMLLSCGFGLVLALFGTVLLVLAVPPGASGMGWGAMAAAAPIRPDLAGMGFVFLLVGYGTLVGLVPLHAWLPGVLAQGAAAGAAVFALLASAALHAVLRAQLVLRAAPDVVSPGRFMVALGLLSLVLAALAAWRSRGVRKRVAWSGVGHAGVTVLCFGLGAPLAGLLHLSGFALLLAAASCALERAGSGWAGPDRAEPRWGGVGWGMALAIAGLAGLPPMALFASQLGLVAAAAREAPWLLLPLCLGLAALTTALASVLPFPRPGPTAPPAGATAPEAWAATAAPWLCVGAALLLGVTVPPLLLEAAAVAGR